MRNAPAVTRRRRRRSSSRRARHRRLLISANPVVPWRGARQEFSGAAASAVECAGSLWFVGGRAARSAAAGARARLRLRPPPQPFSPAARVFAAVPSRRRPAVLSLCCAWLPAGRAACLRRARSCRAPAALIGSRRPPRPAAAAGWLRVCGGRRAIKAAPSLSPAPWPAGPLLLCASHPSATSQQPTYRPTLCPTVSRRLPCPTACCFFCSVLLLFRCPSSANRTFCFRRAIAPFSASECCSSEA